MRGTVLAAALLLALGPFSARADPPPTPQGATVAPVTIPGQLKRSPVLEKADLRYVKTVLAYADGA